MAHTNHVDERPVGPPVVEVDGLHKSYRDQTAVDDVSFQVRSGEIFGILGRNGAGKTTTVECLQGLRRPDRGRLRVLGTDPSNRRRLGRLVGSQLQDAALPDRLRVREALELFAGPGSVDIDELMRSWALDRHQRKAFADLSGGLRQRVFIALALLNRPRLVFLDELTQGLDPLARREVWEVIRSVRSNGATVVLVTHFMDEAEALCDRVAVFDGGRVVAAGSPAEIIQDHATTASITFAESPGSEVALGRVPGLRTVTRQGDRVVLDGHPSMITHACAALVASGPPPADLRIHQPTLEDAVLAIEGAAA